MSATSHNLRTGCSGEIHLPVDAIAELRVAAAVVAGFQNCQGPTIAQGRWVRAAYGHAPKLYAADRTPGRRRGTESSRQDELG